MKRESKDKLYTLVSNKNGISQNYIVLDINKAKNNYYMVCDSSTPIEENSMFKKYFTKTRNDKNENIDISYVSNEVSIDENNTRPTQPVMKDYTKPDGKDALLSWETRDFNIKYYMVFRRSAENSVFTFGQFGVFNDKNNNKNEDVMYYVWAFDKNGNTSMPLFFAKDGGNDNWNDKYHEGLFRVNENRTTVINYKNVIIEIPANSTEYGSIIQINLLDIGRAHV